MPGRAKANQYTVIKVRLYRDPEQAERMEKTFQHNIITISFKLNLISPGCREPVGI